jgi:hypothetical protein
MMIDKKKMKAMTKSLATTALISAFPFPSLFLFIYAQDEDDNSTDLMTTQERIELRNNQSQTDELSNEMDKTLERLCKMKAKDFFEERMCVRT